MPSVNVTNNKLQESSLFEVFGEIESKALISAFDDYKNRGIERNHIWNFTESDMHLLDMDKLNSVAEAFKSYDHLREDGITIVIVRSEAEQILMKLYSTLSQTVHKRELPFFICNSILEAEALLYRYQNIRIVTDGPVTEVKILQSAKFEDIKIALAEVEKLPSLDLLLWDLLDVSLELEQTENVQILSKAKSRPIQPTRMAICVRNKLSFGISRMYLAHREQEGLETNVFESLTTARKWLLQP